MTSPCHSKTIIAIFLAGLAFSAQAAPKQDAAPSQPINVPHFVLRSVEANTASKAELARLNVLGSEVAGQIIAERHKRRFSGWPDLVTRVIGLSDARGAAFASVCGLTVNGKSLNGIPPNAAMAADIDKHFYLVQGVREGRINPGVLNEP